MIPLLDNFMYTIADTGTCQFCNCQTYQLRRTDALSNAPIEKVAITQSILPSTLVRVVYTSFQVTTILTDLQQTSLARRCFPFRGEGFDFKGIRKKRKQRNSYRVVGKNSWMQFVDSLAPENTDSSSDAWGSLRLSADVVERDTPPACPAVVPTSISTSIYPVIVGTRDFSASGRSYFSFCAPTRVCAKLRRNRGVFFGCFVAGCAAPLRADSFK